MKLYAQLTKLADFKSGLIRVFHSYMNFFTRDKNRFVVDFDDLKDWTRFQDPIAFSEYVARQFLEKIPNEMDWADKNRGVFELTVEGFLFFIISAYDRLLIKINEAAKLGLESYDVNERNIKHRLKKLSNKNSVANKILELLDEYTKSWKYYCECRLQDLANKYNDNYLDAKKAKTDLNEKRNFAWLRELKELRNHAIHGNIVNKAMNISDESVGMKIPSYRERFKQKKAIWQKDLICDQTSDIIQECQIYELLIVTMEIRKDARVKKQIGSDIVEPNPKTYFESSYSKFVELRQNIEKCLKAE